MTQIQYRWMDPEEVTRIEDIDRSERIRTGYKLTDGELQQMDVNWDLPSWMREGEGEYSVAAQIRSCRARHAAWVFLAAAEADVGW